ncbi:inositol phospholipid synthesis and fat-storage-inducing TM-domain-containing protein [Hypoxylon trugodes]|uniref:inositol phospholipid synthesis and fat-storage-inducing TM-domain-containing protein n=1 Tax=Hypoxylon trugodes TaxID=326681 RepID=UPI00219B72DB|nr:inositol phospholipid synthesis and fat-storage-inducing TM-domain-containing protein [Hypoxylon trugodes]KAI1393822.1 inositol phospholipid synthesis and fat-storage-inducing TM-domain-containing protein [Hypoxylon trugodes]
MTDANDTTNTSYSLKARQKAKMAGGSEANGPNFSPSSSIPTKRNPPYLPTPLETLVLAAYPALLAFGTVFSIISPQALRADDDSYAYSAEHPAPSYFARKDNVFNTFFVKRGWGWITVAFALFVGTHATFSSTAFPQSGAVKRVKAGVRWVAVTAWWIVVTQWCFGPPLIDRGFRFTGGKCEVATKVVVKEGVHADAGDVFTAAACRAVGGRWSGGHDISGHVFLLVLGSFFLIQEVGWVVYRAGRAGGRDERCVVMPDGAVKGAGVEAERTGSTPEEKEFGLGGKFAAVVVGLCLWMLLMTAIYFHTWFEKLTGLLVAAMGIYPVYILPRWVPALRAIVGLPGI